MGLYFYYNGKVWVKDVGSIFAKRLAKKFAVKKHSNFVEPDRQCPAIICNRFLLGSSLSMISSTYRSHRPHLASASYVTLDICVSISLVRQEVDGRSILDDFTNYPLTDIGSSKLYADMFKNELRFVREMGLYFYYNLDSYSFTQEV